MLSTFPFSVPNTILLHGLHQSPPFHRLLNISEGILFPGGRRLLFDRPLSHDEPIQEMGYAEARDHFESLITLWSALCRKDEFEQSISEQKILVGLQILNLTQMADLFWRQPYANEREESEQLFNSINDKWINTDLPDIFTSLLLRSRNWLADGTLLVPWQDPDLINTSAGLIGYSWRGSDLVFAFKESAGKILWRNKSDILKQTASSSRPEMDYQLALNIADTLQAG